MFDFANIVCSDPRQDKLLKFRGDWLFVLLTVVAMATPHQVLAQGDTIVTNFSAPPVPNAGHDYITMLDETVNPGSGSVSLRIPIPTPKGRGLNFPFSLNYDSNQSLILQNIPGVGLTWLPQLSGFAVSGWSFPVPTLTDVVNSYQLTGEALATGDTSSVCDEVTGFAFTDLDGVSHPMSGLSYIYDNVTFNMSTPSANSILDSACEASGFSGIGSAQESGGYFSSLSYTGDPVYQMYLTNILPDQTILPLMSSPYDATPIVTGPDGTVYTFPAALYCPYSYPACTFMPSSIEDRNGNKINFNSNGALAIDTAGRKTISINGFTQNPTSTTVTLADNSAYTLTWGLKSYSGYTVPATFLSGYGCSNGTGIVTNPQTEDVVTQLTLPNGKHYTFQYDDTYGTLKQITYPNGGYVRYTYGIQSDYGYFVEITARGYSCAYRIGMLMVATRQTGFTSPNLSDPYSSDQVPIQTQTFTYGTPTLNQGIPAQRTTTVQTTDAASGASYQTLYSYLGTATNALETSIVYNDTTGSTLKRVTKSWLLQVNPPLACEVETIGSTGPSRGTIYEYAQGNVLSDKLEYDYGQITPAACGSSGGWWGGPGYGVTLPSGIPARETISKLQTFATTNYGAAPSLFDRPCRVIVYDSTGRQPTATDPYAGSRASETDFYYDGGTSLCGPASAQITAAVDNLPLSTHDEALYSASGTISRGNATAITKICFLGCVDSTTYYTYDKTGEVTSVTDPNTNVTKIGHVDNPLGAFNTNAYVTIIDPPHVNNISHATTFSYDYSTGNVSAVTDPNNQTTTYTYNDPLQRLTQIQYPDNGVTGYCYSDWGGSYPGGTCANVASNFQVYSGTAEAPGLSATSSTTYDGLGRPIQNAVLLVPGPGGPIYTDTAYNGFGQVKSATNPYQGSPTGSVSYAYDALGRKILQTQQDGSALGWCYDGFSNAAWSTCNSNQSGISNSSWVNSQDESGHLSQHVSDGLGRLTAAMEQLPSGSTLGLKTLYTYDSLDNLTYVNQTGVAGSDTARGRRFRYDSLSRLTLACNPENLPAGLSCDGSHWSNQYSYYPNGDLQYKTDGRGVTTNYFYDNLNRISAKTYSNAPTGSLLSCYSYDSALNGIGRLAAEWTTPSSCSSTTGYQSMRTFLAYDPMGRLWNEQQCVLSNCTTGTSTPPCRAGTQTGISHCYNLAGSPSFLSNGLTTPALTFTNAYDQIGRLSTLTSSWNYSTPQNLFTVDPSAGYAPSGQILSFRLGNNVSVTKTYDNRLRPVGETAASQ